MLWFIHYDFTKQENSDLTLVSIEKKHILKVLQMTGNNLMKTAEILGIMRNTLKEKIKKFEILKTPFINEGDD
jgi:DNA-binding protein Fis